jgi:hypothetical protein
MGCPPTGCANDANLPVRWCSAMAGRIHPNTNLAAATPQPLTRPPTLRLLTLHHLSAARHTPPHSSRLRPNASHYAQPRHAARHLADRAPRPHRRHAQRPAHPSARLAAPSRPSPLRLTSPAIAARHADLATSSPPPIHAAHHADRSLPLKNLLGSDMPPGAQMIDGPQPGGCPGADEVTAVARTNPPTISSSS